MAAVRDGKTKMPIKNPPLEVASDQHFLPNFGHNAWRGAEKWHNALPVEHFSLLFFVYVCTAKIRATALATFSVATSAGVEGCCSNKVRQRKEVQAVSLPILHFPFFNEQSSILFFFIPLHSTAPALISSLVCSSFVSLALKAVK